MGSDVRSLWLNEPGAHPLDDGAVDRGVLEELDALALAAGDPGSVEPDAIPLSAYLAMIGRSSPVLGGLPSWYMAPATGRPRGRWRLPVVLAVIGAFLLIDAWGLCNTFGQLTLA